MLGLRMHIEATVENSATEKNKNGDTSMRALAISILFSTMALLMPDANAARANSSNVIYFNAAGEPVGQDASYCNGVHWQGGDLTTPYRLIIRGGCGGLIITCSPDNNGTPKCNNDMDFRVTYIMSGSPPFTDEEACDLVGRLPCQSSEPELLFTYGFELKRLR